MGGYLSLSISESGVNIPNNTSVVTVNVYYYGNGMSWNAESRPGTIYIDGYSYGFSHSFTTSTSSQWLGSASRTITHNSDGSRYVGCSASFSTDVSLGTISTSGGITLTKIPRVSDLSVSSSSIVADGKQTITVTANKKSSGFTDTLSFKLGSRSMNIESGVPFSIPVDWCNEMPDATHSIGTVIVTTRSGSTVIGTRSAAVNVKVPSYLTPDITAFDINEAVTSVAAAFNRYCKGLSKLSINTNATAYYGATIRAYNITVDDATYTENKFISNVLMSSGKLPVKLTVTDSRGKTASQNKEIEVYSYKPPAIESLKFEQGSVLTVMVRGAVDSVEGNNTKTLIIKYKSVGDTDYISRVIPLDSWDFDVSTTLNLDTSLTYDVMAELTDKIGSATNSTVTGIPVISRLAGGKGITIGAEAEREGFVLSDGWDLIIVNQELEDKLVATLGKGVKA